MISRIDWRIPPSVLDYLGKLPLDRPVVLLLRHSVRGELPSDAPGNDVLLTETGHTLARELGEQIGSRLKSMHSSPIPRCVQTAEAICAGAGATLPVALDRLLGDPGIFVLDGARAWDNWQQLGHECVMANLVSGSEALPGMAHPDHAARFLVHHALTQAGGVPGTHIYVTHDSVIAATASRLLGRPHGPADWPWYLEGAFFMRSRNEKVRCAYRDQEALIHEPLCRLDERDVTEFARREAAMTVGLDCPARFFLAGGAFKTLLTGRPPRDLDFWAPSPEDRALLISTLLGRGARRLPNHQFAEAFEIADRVVEVPKKAEPSSLDERLARFDIALSAIGVEFRPGDGCTARIHPLAQESAKTRQVRLLKPDVRKDFASVTLERLRRYAAELDFEVPSEEEAVFMRANGL